MSERAEMVNDLKLFVGMAALVFSLFWLSGCLAPVTVNVFSSRLVSAYGTNTVCQSVDGGAILSSNALTATMPLK